MLLWGGIQIIQLAQQSAKQIPQMREEFIELAKIAVI